MNQTSTEPTCVANQMLTELLPKMCYPFLDSEWPVLAKEYPYNFTRLQWDESNDTKSYSTIGDSIINKSSDWILKVLLWTTSWGSTRHAPQPWNKVHVAYMGHTLGRQVPGGPPCGPRESCYLGTATEHRCYHVAYIMKLMLYLDPYCTEINSQITLIRRSFIQRPRT